MEDGRTAALGCVAVAVTPLKHRCTCKLKLVSSWPGCVAAENDHATRGFHSQDFFCISVPKMNSQRPRGAKNETLSNTTFCFGKKGRAVVCVPSSAHWENRMCMFLRPTLFSQPKRSALRFFSGTHEDTCIATRVGVQIGQEFCRVTFRSAFCLFRDSHAFDQLLL